jgi:hypothetical protein
MSLEQMNKPQLVKELRETIQLNKELATRIKELEDDKVNGNVPEGDVVQTGEVKLPYLAVSLLRGRGKYFIVKLAYDLKGNAKVLSKVEKAKDYNAYYDAERFLNTDIDKQMLLAEDMVGIKETVEV